MARSTKAGRIAAGLAVLFLAAWGSPGCSDKSKKSQKVRTIEGIAKHIDLKNNDVSMVFKDERGVERELRGTVRENTEVRINGRDQRLEDLRENDRIKVTGFKEGSGTEAQLIATMIEVVRPQESDWKKATTQPGPGGTPPLPTTQPAGRP